MKGIIKARRAAYRAAAVAAGLDVTKNYFALSWDELNNLQWIADLYKYTSSSTTGRSRLQAFWYAIQAGE